MEKRNSLWLVVLMTAVLLLAACASGGSGSIDLGGSAPDGAEGTLEPGQFNAGDSNPRSGLQGWVKYTPTASSTPLPTAVPTSTPEPKPTVPMSELQRILPIQPPDGSRAEVVIADMNTPVTVILAPDGRIFYTEKETGNVRVAVDGQLLPEPVYTATVGISGEQGMIGVVLDPDFENNQIMWVSHTMPARANNGIKENRILRLKLDGNVATEAEIAYRVDNSQGDGTHNLNNMAFGPDGMLYVTIGDDAQPHLAPNLEDPRGKIHRFKPTVPLSAPEDNPFYDGDGPNEDSVYAYGMRNSFDFTFDPLSEEMHILATENGPECDDEVNLVLPGNNYGWKNHYDCLDQNRYGPENNTIPPMLTWEGTSSPTGIMVYTGDDFPQWYGDVFFCSYVDGLLHHLEMNRERTGFVNHHSLNGLFCQTDILNGPNGEIYFLEGGGFAPGNLKRLYHSRRDG